MTRAAARLRVTGPAALDARPRLAPMPVNEVGMHVARRNGIRCASHGDEASHPLIALERGDRGDAGRVHVAPRAALARMTYRARRLRLGGRNAVRLKEIRALMRG